jgi:hypothetical protein
MSTWAGTYSLYTLGVSAVTVSMDDIKVTLN